MPHRLLLIIATCLALSACSLPGLPGQQTATPQPATAEPESEPTPTEEPEAATPEATERPAEARPTARPAEPEPTEEPESAFRQAPCEFDVPAGLVVECGFLSVPENRADPASPLIELAVAIFRSFNPNPEPDPIVYIEGGPGGSALKGVPLTFEDNFAPFLADRDLIMYDQRGAGFSRPALTCDEYTRLAYDTLDQDLTVDESNALFADAMKACRDRLARDGIQFSQYNSLASAADLADMRVALGYDEWNLYAISYGTRLALTTMREHPEGIRSVILDSASALQSDETSVPAAADRVFAKLFEGCRADPACDAAYPNLEQTFYDLVDRLSDAPVTGRATNAVTGRSYDVLLNGDMLISVVFQALYSSDLIPLLPKTIAAAAEDLDYSLLFRLAVNSAYQSEFISYGMYFTVRCNEEIPFTTMEELSAADDPFPEQRGVFGQEFYADICPMWDAGQAPPVEDQPVSSDLPTLVMAGEYDPIIPPEESEETSQTLSRSFFFLFPGLGHGVSTDGGCPLSIARAFLDDPTTRPDDACIAAMGAPEFAVVGGPVALEPLESPEFGFTGVLPEGWVMLSPGIYGRTEAGDIAILQLALPGSEESTLQFLAQQFDLQGDLAPVGTRETDSLTWNLYRLEVQGLPVDLALSQEQARTYIVMLVSDVVERDSLYDQVFLPALDAFTPN